MSGHNKWAQIKHKKAITDQKKGQIFSKLAKAISIAARGNPDPKTNIQLKSIIDKARSLNMPNDNIDRALKKVSEKNQAQLEELVIEIIGPSGIGFLVTAITDNRNRTINEIKIILSKNDAHLGTPGSVLWMFTKNQSEYQPNYPIDVTDKDLEAKLEKLYSLLDEQDDVQEVFINANII